MIRALLFISIYFIFSNSGYGDSKKSSDNITSYSYGEIPSIATPEEALKNYYLWKKNFIVQEGEYVRVKWVNPEQTTSEGIGWGMLLAVYANDSEVFEGLWNYYNAHRNVHGLMHAKIDAAYGIVSYNALSGADFDACLALIAAIRQWPEKAGEYHVYATDLLNAIRKYEIDTTNYTVRSTDQPVSGGGVNTAYLSPAHFRVFGEFSKDTDFWNKAADNCYRIIDENLKQNNACGGLVSDRANVGGDHTANNTILENGRTYYYNAARVPFRVALDYIWTGNKEAKDYLNRCNDFVLTRLGGAENIVDGYTQDGAATGNYHNSSFVGPFACAAMIGYNSMYLTSIYSDLIGIEDGNSFYSQSVKTLSLFMLAGLFSQPVESLKHRSETILLSEMDGNSNNLVAPNPFLEQTTLNNLSAEKDVYPLVYEIIDEQGIVYESSVISSPNQAIGSELSSGIYLMQITYAGKVKVVRLHKK